MKTICFNCGGFELSSSAMAEIKSIEINIFGMD
jgi:hypothetical protein